MKQFVIMSQLLLILLGGATIATAAKQHIGETAWITIEGIPFDYLTRIDTGARTTSIHAINTHIENADKKAANNVGKTITFDSADHTGHVTTLSGKIIKVSTVTNSQGTEQRYVVELNLSWRDISKTVQVNLRDRSKMTYKLLIGRNWLTKDFLVDVDLKAEPRGE